MTPSDLGGLTPTQTTPTHAGSIALRRQGSGRRNKAAGLGLLGGATSTDTGGNIMIGFQSDREVVNGLTFPKAVANKIPKYQRRNNSETMILQCFVDLYLRPEKPIKKCEDVKQVSIATGGDKLDPSPEVVGGSKKKGRRGSFGNNKDSVMLDVPLAEWTDKPRGPFPVRVSIHATPQEAAEECITVLRAIQYDDVKAHEQLLLQQQRHIEAVERRQAAGAETSAQRKAHATSNSRRRTNVPNAPSDDNLPPAVPESAFRITPVTLQDLDVLPQDGEGLALRRCDALGSCQTGDKLFNPGGSSLLRQMIPNAEYTNNSLALHVVLAPDPEFFSMQVRRNNLERVRQQRSVEEELKQRRLKMTDFVEEKRRLAEVDGMLHSQDRDQKIRKIIQIPSASAEVQHWRKNMLLQTKKSDHEQQLQAQAARERQIADFYRALTKEAIHKEMQYTQDHEDGARQLQLLEADTRETLITDFKELGRTIETTRRANARLRTIAGTVERDVARHLDKYW